MTQTAALKNKKPPLSQEKPVSYTAKTANSGSTVQFHYYGARYLDTKTSRWLSADPALGEYVPVAPLGENERRHNSNLPGIGGVFNLVNLHVYHYAGNNPVNYTDPDGRTDWWQIGGGTAQVIGGVVLIAIGAFGEGVSMGTSTFLLIWGAKEVLDGANKIITGIYDVKYHGLIATGTGALAVNISSMDDASTIESVVGMMESIFGIIIPANGLGKAVKITSYAMSGGAFAFDLGGMVFGITPNENSPSTYRRMEMREIYERTVSDIQRLDHIGTPTSMRSAANLRNSLRGLLESAIINTPGVRNSLLYNEWLNEL